MSLYRIDVSHYGPKDSHDSIEAYVVADDVEHVIKWLADKKHASWGNWDEEDDTDAAVYPSKEWWNDHPAKRQQALNMGLEVDKYGDVRGSRYALLRWWQGDFSDPEDCYYGVTQYSWVEIEGANESDIDALIRLGVAIRI